MQSKTTGGCATDKQSQALMHTHTRPSAEALGVAAHGNKCQEVGRIRTRHGRCPRNKRRTKQDEHGQRDVSPLQPPSPWHSVPTQDFLLSHTRVEAQTELECKRDLQATYGLRYLSRLQQLLLKELDYSLLRSAPAQLRPEKDRRLGAAAFRPACC